MSSVALIFPHQLYKEHPAVSEGRKAILIEEFLYFNHYHFHKQKLVLHRAGMKMYEALLIKKKIAISYIKATEKHSDVRELGAWLSNQKITEAHFAGLSDDWLHRRLLKSLAAHSIKAIIYPTPNFITDSTDADAFFATKKGYFQTDFYIWQRKRFNILVEKDGKPKGGKWSFDDENRSPFPKGEIVPEINFPKQDSVVKEAIAYVENNWPDNYGSIEHFRYPTNHAQAEKWLEDFLKNRFEKFGVYEDAMVANEHYLYHSVITPMLNTGLLNPKQVVNAAIKIAREKDIPLNSVEGYIRQVIGWREFIHAVYMREGRKQRTRNYWTFHRPIPHQFWTGETGILPVDTVIKKALKTGYSHHIERLMVMGNFMLLCEFDPDEVYRWFMEMYIDAYDWVMVPNTYGMTQFSDGGLMMTKPYISGSNYLMKMGDWKSFEKDMHQTEPEQVLASPGEHVPAPGQAELAVKPVAEKSKTKKAIISKTQTLTWQQIWDGLFWRFMHVHRSFFLQNPRLGMLVNSFDKMDAEKRKTHLANAEIFLKTIRCLEYMSLRKKPWNRISLAVYSISSKTTHHTNMNICTYVSAVSMKPKRMMVAIYHNTKTLDNISQHPDFVLQLLAANQYPLISLLGRQSGHSIDKMQRLQKRALLTEWNGFMVLKDALALMQLQVLQEMEGGDHRLCLCDVLSYKNLNEGEPLTTNILHEKGIIRI